MPSVTWMQPNGSSSRHCCFAGLSCAIASANSRPPWNCSPGLAGGDATVAPPPPAAGAAGTATQPPARPFAWGITALLGVAVIGLGLVQQQTNRQLAQLQNQLSSQAQGEIRSAWPSSATAPRRLPLQTTTAGLPTNGEVMVTGNPTHNVLMLNNLPPAPPRHFYRLWARVDGELVGCVAFVPTEQGHVAMLIPPMPTSLATSVSVSLETDPIGRSPTGPMLLSSSL